MPADEGVRPHDDEGVLPVEQPTQRCHHEPSRVVGTARSALPFDKERELLPEEEILRGQGAPGTREIASERDRIETTCTRSEGKRKRSLSESRTSMLRRQGRRRAADPARSKPQNQRRIDLLRTTGVGALGTGARASEQPNAETRQARVLFTRFRLALRRQVEGIR